MHPFRDNDNDHLLLTLVEWQARIKKGGGGESSSRLKRSCGSGSGSDGRGRGGGRGLAKVVAAVATRHARRVTMVVDLGRVKTKARLSVSTATSMTTMHWSAENHVAIMRRQTSHTPRITSQHCCCLCPRGRRAINEEKVVPRLREANEYTALHLCKSFFGCLQFILMKCWSLVCLLCTTV